jgi:uncharacterized protein YutD
MTVIYLDLNKWIQLANAFYKENGKLFELAVKCFNNQSDLIFPLSSSHIIEVRKRKNIQSRKKLADFMAGLSLATFIASNVTIRPYELELATCKMFGYESEPDTPKFLGKGIYFPFGLKNEHNIKSDEEFSHHEMSVMQSPPIIAAFLKGKDAFEDLNTKGIKEHVLVQQTIAKKEERIRNEMLDYSKAVRYRFKAAEFMMRYEKEFNAVLEKYDLTVKDLDENQQALRESFFQSAPSFDVELELTTQRNNHYDRIVDPNDILDVDFLSRAIPYCDVVITEKFWVSLAKRKKLDVKYNTHITSDLNDLEKYI